MLVDTRFAGGHGFPDAGRFWVGLTTTPNACRVLPEAGGRSSLIFTLQQLVTSALWSSTARSGDQERRQGGNLLCPHSSWAARGQLMGSSWAARGPLVGSSWAARPRCGPSTVCSSPPGSPPVCWVTAPRVPARPSFGRHTRMTALGRRFALLGKVVTPRSCTKV